MENFVVSARKYRPAHFNTVVGQAPITTTLKNAIRNNHLAQAFLFCGPRGVGKTTCARILAKTINCTNLTAETEACEQCESCMSFNSGRAIDITELDAASNNSVDDIRNLVDTVRIPPQLAELNPKAKKVYVIDEVHMLSAGAFNAFLKTLEEPPPYAIFILATTERHKILPTILSRCQVFNFNRIQVDDIANHLAFIAKNEGVEAEPDALHVIAQKADGALRDACSIFDQVVSFAGNKLSYKAVIDNLNVLDYDYYFRVTDFLLEENIPGTLLLFNEILSNGFDGHNFVSGLAEHFRNLLVCKDPQTLQLLEVGQNIRERYKVQSEKCSQMFLLRALGLVNKCDVGYKSARNPRLLVEFTLMQLTALNAPAGAEKKNDNSIDVIPHFGTKRSISSETSATQTEPVKAANPQPEVVQKSAAVPVAESLAAVAEPVVKIQSNPQPVKKPLLKSSPSISSFTNQSSQKKEETLVAEQPGIQRAEPFLQEALESAWTAYANFVRTQKNETDYHSLTMAKPVKVSDEVVTFTIFNSMALENLNRSKTEMMGFLRRMLKNNAFQLEFILSKEEGAQKIYTPADKYKRLAEINPALKKLREQFDLDVEF
jgi:DNA polymerase III subunit gamma/tau